MKLDNKGFAISGILYAVMILFLTLVVSLLAMISNRKLVLDKYKKEVKGDLNAAIETYGARVQIAPDATYIRITEDEIADYDFKSDVSGCVLGNDASSEERETLCQENETDITKLLNYKIYDEIGNEVIDFYSNVVASSDGYRVNIVSYGYYERDNLGNYVLDETKNKLKIVQKNLNVNAENIFYVRYYVIDNNNILSKEATRTLLILKYNNYVNVINNYFVVSKNNLLEYDFLSNADSYKYDNNNLIKDNNLLQYKIYNDSDELVTNFFTEDDNLYYRVKNSNIKITGEERFRIRYFTGTIENPKSDVEFAYFAVE